MKRAEIIRHLEMPLSRMSPEELAAEVGWRRSRRERHNVIGLLAVFAGMMASIYGVALMSEKAEAKRNEHQQIARLVNPDLLGVKPGRFWERQP